MEQYLSTDNSGSSTTLSRWVETSNCNGLLPSFKEVSFLDFRLITCYIWHEAQRWTNLKFSVANRIKRQSPLRSVVMIMIHQYQHDLDAANGLKGQANETSIILVSDDDNDSSITLQMLKQQVFLKRCFSKKVIYGTRHRLAARNVTWAFQSCELWNLHMLVLFVSDGRTFLVRRSICVSLKHKENHDNGVVCRRNGWT
ncbi:hypothetical protein MKW98_016092 [Papaver atlanticum]|uniref:Uncharacterized protein n=1 Tax=Papaver atlanticum TaxID=357466 RepID=A0AAD4XRT6_9MAGN|nr:hypothetical protein MKW98_016092 [Papaver atlanticum]